MIDRSVMAAFLNGELSEQEAAPVRAALDCDPEARQLADELDNVGELGRLVEDALALVSFASDPQAIQTGARLREFGSTWAIEETEELSESQGPQNSSGIQLPCSFGEFDLLEVLSEGGMGTVYKAWHRNLHRLFAVKVIAAHRLASEQARRRFQREVSLNGRLKHPHLVRAVSAGQADDQPFLVMELLEGQDVGRLARRWVRMPIAEACEIVRQAAIGVDFLARQGLVHRDLKPSNLMLTRRDDVELLEVGKDRQSGWIVKILDLGLACDTEASPPDEITVTDQVLGTIDYLAPEQATDPRRVDTRADIYALGCTLYRLLAGATPFSHPGMETPVAKLLAHHQQQPPPLRRLRPELPRELTAIIERAMAKKRSRRFRNGRELVEALEPFCTGADLGRLFNTEPAIPAPPLPEPKATPYRTMLGRFSLLSIICLLIAFGIVIRVRANRVKLIVKSPGDDSRIEIELDNRDADVPVSQQNLESAQPELPHEPTKAADEARQSKQVPARPLTIPFDATQAARGQAASAARTGVPIEVTNSVGMVMRLIPPGGDAKGDTSAPRCEYPLFMTVHEISQRDYEQVVGRSPRNQRSEPMTGDAALPVGHVAWHEAIEFCRRLSDLPAERQAGRRYTLPTQAEWAWACKAGNEADLPWPSERVREHVAMREPAARRVASFAPNAFGLFDMHGNMAEWAADWTTMRESPGSPNSNTLAPVLCGGSFDSHLASQVSATAREPLPVDRSARPDCGFRVICRLAPDVADADPFLNESSNGFDPMIVLDGSLRGWGFPGGHVTNADGLLEQAVDNENGNWGTIWYGRHGNLHDFDIRFDFKIDGHETETQLLFRANVLERGWQEGAHYRLSLSGPKMGILYRYDPSGIRVVAVFPADQLTRLRVDTWNRLALRCVGRRTRIWLNDEPSIDFADPMPDVCLHGPLSFLTTGPANTQRRLALFRNLRIKLLGHPPTESLKPMPWTMGADALPANSPPVETPAGDARTPSK